MSHPAGNVASVPEPVSEPVRLDPVADKRAGSEWRRWRREVWAVHLAEHEAFDCCEWRNLDDFLGYH